MVFSQFNKKKALDTKIPVYKDPFVWRTIFALFLFILTLLLITSWWLKCYTRHGQSIDLPDFVGKSMDQAMDLAKKHDFTLVKVDSTFLVDKPGSLILQQTPPPGSPVKEDRKVYVVVTKHNADLIPLSALPKLYGQSYEVKKEELERGFEIQSSIAGYVYDAGPSNYIMGAIYNGDTILSAKMEKKEHMLAKGSALQFILSTDTGADIPIPNVTCLTYSAASFLLTSLGLVVDEIEEDVIDDINISYVVHQEPVYDPSGRMQSGDTVHIFLNPKKPVTCPE